MLNPGRSKFRALVFKTFTIVGVLTTAIVALIVLSLVVQCASADRVASGTVLELHLERPLPDAGGDDPLSAALGRSGTSMSDVLAAIERASHDERVVGLVAYVGATDHGMARTEDLRDAIARFRAEGKFAVAFAETFGELAPGNQGYYLATAFDEIWMQPTGAVGLTGLISESMFVRGTLDMVGVAPQGDHRREFKNAFNMYTERAFTDSHREAAKSVMDDMFTQLVQAIADRRGLSAAEVRTLVDRGPFLGQEALEAKLVDGLAYRDEVIAKVKERAGGAPHLLFAEKYVERAGRPHQTGRKIALVEGLGGVQRGQSSVDPLTGESSMGSDTVAAALRAAIDDDSIEAIVFRVDSPGGSAVASDTIWRETVRAKEAGKPLIVSMGNVAGSGGYYVACAATKIVAQPSTITGSIGVLGGKPLTRDGWSKLGVTWDSVQTSDNAELFSGLHPYDDAGWARLQAWLDFVYADFKGRVAEGRGMSPDAVEAVAKGRIWSGARAKELGLVDELGGLYEAIALAKSEAGIGADEEIHLVRIPEPRGFLEQMFAEGPESSEDRNVAATSEIAVGLERLRPVARRLRAAGLGLDDPGVLSMFPVEVGN